MNRSRALPCRTRARPTAVAQPGALRVMIVNDRDKVRTAVSQAIEGPDLTVAAEAGTVPEALEVALGSRPDVVLVDVDVDGGHGVQLVRELSPRLPNTKFIILSGSTVVSDLLDAVMAGAAGYLGKNVNAGALARAIRSARKEELVMPRALAARLIGHLAEAARHRGWIDDPALAVLSGREREVLRLVAGGKSDREIAIALTISPRTAETHVAAILRKLDVRNRAEAASLYRRGRSMSSPVRGIDGTRT
jgi:DNA-binding NarL/FixJ family response regulator